MPPLRIQNPQLRVAIEVRQSVTFNNLTNSISKKRGRASREIVHPQPGRASGCLSPVRAKRAVRCFGAQTFFIFFLMNQTAERLISPAAQAGPCVLLVSETKTSAEGMKEDAGSKKEEGKGEECHQHFGCGGKERSSETSEERGDNNHKKFGRTYLSNRPPRSSCLA